jgi:hypothetical protein
MLANQVSIELEWPPKRETIAAGTERALQILMLAPLSPASL